MSVIGTLAVNVVAKTNQFAKDMANARKTTKDFGKEVDDTSKMMRTFGRLMTGGLIIGGAAKLTGSLLDTAKSIDHIAKTANKLGITTEKLQGLSYAAELSGVSSSKLEMSMQRLVRRTAEAAQGTGEAVSAYRELGLNANKLIGLSPDQIFYQVADAMKDVDGQANKVRLAFKLFDSEGVDLVNTLEGGSESLKKMQKEAQKLGIVFSSQEAKQIEKFNDEMTKLSKWFEGAKMSFVIDIAPEVLGTVESLQKIYSLIKGDLMKSPILRPLAEGPNRENSFMYRWYEDKMMKAGHNMGGGDAAMTEDEWNARAARSASKLKGMEMGLMGGDFKTREYADPASVIKSMRDEMFGEQSAYKRPLQDKLFGNNNITNRIKSATGGLNSLLESIPKIDQGEMQAMGNRLFMKRMANGLGFGVGGRSGSPMEMFQAQMGAGGALEYGSAAAFAALRKNQNPTIQISKDQLAEAKRQSAYLAKIAEKEPIELVEEGV